MPSSSETSNQSERNARMERNLIQTMNEYQVPGLSIAMIREFSVVWSGAYGVLRRRVLIASFEPARSARR